MGSRRFGEPTTIDGIDAEGRSVTISMASVLAIMPDCDRLGWTMLHVENGIVLVEGDYEGWMDRMAANWTWSCRTAAH